MEFKFKVAAHISKPVDQVFEAVVNPTELSRYFTTGGAKGRLETGATVYWEFHDFPGSFPVQVVETEPNRRIVLRWQADDVPDDGSPTSLGSAGYLTTVTMTFEPLDDGKRTLVTVAEEGWRETASGLRASYGNCQGWMQMLCSLKAHVEYGINLREGMFV